uniref:Ornithine decarboxylase n=1 Tax=Tetraselmis sp. GSL018 TaxID=582737 RepID=A0A061RZV3_9CHLO|mmetsp:Transcript_2724/g.6363  ORF Transcript_2724/g.6363 Transcript_2724/m.6363 type:complete len:836 (+) Transcript_2724:661-3168(+)|eukprot:CAMPEP_0177613030 /NCGR_PEP_ID=MMETSP0419_2-20121207/21677_1 /TAXON_ID=582737 /ORGANISM="Tetraselmis sp., Strain GSL018" /LENGTH=835 /DNA_ID=CAMNT_0019109539 /DNA_START=630 /DNA_END=3137 /DNA_ORIENTATION=-
MAAADIHGSASDLPCPVFEGSEKRLEVDFTLCPSDTSQLGLRAVQRQKLDSLLEKAACSIVSVRSNPHFDAYVLSESSLFVYPRKWVLKTCGTTKLLASVPGLLEYADELGMMAVRVKYSRASYLFPDKQPEDHKFFSDEAAFLEGHFGHIGLSGGRAQVLGDPLRGLQWHVYTAGADIPPHRATQTLEVCMTGLNTAKAACFHRGPDFRGVEELTRSCGIRALAPFADMDAILFDPCGYSLNGLEGPGFLTIHITPEEACSYASVEFCGFTVGSYSPTELVSRIADIFEPRALAVCMSTDATVCDQVWNAELELPPLFAESADRSSVALNIGGQLSYITGVRAPGKEMGSPPGETCAGTPPRGSMHRSLSFASTMSCDTVTGALQHVPPSSDAQSGSASAGEDSDLVSVLMGYAGGNNDLAAVLASHGVVPSTCSSIRANMREKAAAVIAASDPEALDVFYLYDLGVVRRLYAAWSEALPRVHAHYAVKCNSNPALISTLSALGAGFDCASRAELDLVLGLGVPPERVVYANCCKLPREMRYALHRGVSVSVVDSRSELEKSAAMTPDASLLLRIRADDPSARCQLGNKYGIEMEDVPELLTYAAELGLNLVGVSFHVGSGSKNPAAFEEAIFKSRKVFDAAEKHGFSFTMLDIGGGMASCISDVGEVSFVGDFPGAINSALDRWFPPESGTTIIAEPGRFFAEPAAMMATAVFGYRERQGPPGGRPKDYYITDGLYGSFNAILYDHANVSCEPLRSPLLPPVEDAPPSAWSRSVVFGPTCDGLDTVLENFPLPDLRNGDWLLFPNMGAYTIAGATNFNGINVTHLPTFYTYTC